MNYLTLFFTSVVLSPLAASSPVPISKLWKKIEKREVGALTQTNTTEVASTGSTSPSATASTEDEDFIYFYDPSTPIEESDVIDKRRTSSKDVHTTDAKDEREDEDFIYLYDPKLDEADAAPAAKPIKTVSNRRINLKDIHTRGTKDEDEDFIYFYDPRLDNSDAASATKAKAVSKRKRVDLKNTHTRYVRNEDVDYIYLYDPVAAGEVTEDNTKNIQKHQKQQ